MSEFPDARRVDLGDITLSVHDAGSGPAVVLCHGFPELARSWRHQFGPLVDAGFRVIAADGRGYGGSDVPERVEDYDIVHLAEDMVGLLDALGIERAVFVGHDWGGVVAWAMPVLHPDRCLGVIGVNTPYVMPPPTEMLSMVFPDPDDLYILWFQKPEIPEQMLDARVRQVFEVTMRRLTSPPPVPSLASAPRANPFLDLDSIEPLGEPLLDEAELEAYVSAFERSGFFGPISWYRNIDRNRQIAPELGQKDLDLPALQITTTWDPTSPPESAEQTKAHCSDLELHLIDECGHWTPQEKPDELNGLMVDWLVRRFKREQ